jgi:GT2 family glycosyltransferase/glycosyltransferase involved in cell wall biosynthesis
VGNRPSSEERAHIARLRIRRALDGERTTIGILSALVQLGAREPAAIMRAATLPNLARLARRLVAPAALASHRAVIEPNPLEIEARAVARRFAQPIDLADARPITFRLAESPEISFVIPVWNRWQLTYKCLAAIADNIRDVPYEVIVVDNGSSDETAQVLERIANVRVVRNARNLGYLLAINQGALEARGKYLLLLNNDAHILSGTVPALLSTIASDPRIGAVGGRIVLPDGRLQEAGSIVWRDGSCLGYGRGADPFEPQYSYLRDVDFCSAALLLTPRELFLQIGLFDERYVPAYYEDADYCMALSANGYRVVYQPAAVVIHHEFGSAPRREAAIAAQARNQDLFAQKWSVALGTQMPPSPEGILVARDATRRRRLLFVDDRVPDPRLGSGFPRTRSMLTSLRDLGWAVTFFPLQDPEPIQPCTSDLEALGIEVITRRGGPRLDLETFLKRRSGHYDVVLISRPHNMKEALPFLRKVAPRARIVYDAEAIFAVRDLQLLELKGIPAGRAIAEAMIRDEVSLARSADAVTAVSRREAHVFEDFGVPGALVVGHSLEPRPASTPFSHRAGLLFVGSLDSGSPNEDALLHFTREIFPFIRRRLGCTLLIVGANQSRTLSSVESTDVRIIGPVDDLAPWYARARVFVVPTRYAAGMPMKLHEASAFGLPSVVTPLVAEQVGWRDGREVLVGASPEDFARRVVELYSDSVLWQRVGADALAAVRRDCSSDTFVASLRAAIGTPESSLDSGHSLVPAAVLSRERFASAD